MISSAFFLGAEAPNWFSNPQKDSTVFYGLGIGENLNNAKKSAIGDLANSIQVSIASTFDKTTTRENDQISSTVSQITNLQSQIDDLTNLDVTQSQCDNKGRCYVRVEIKKSFLIKQLEQRVQQKIKDFMQITSPFAYQEKKEVYEKIQKDYLLYISLGGKEMQIPSLERPVFSLDFRYDGDFSAGFKSILEQTIQDFLTKMGSVSNNAQWKITINVLKEEKNVVLDISSGYNGEVFHNASVYDTQKPNISTSFFAKRLGAQACKKMKKWSNN